METEKIKTGDILLFGGSKGIMGKLIRYFDRATYTHTGIAIEIYEKIFVLDMWTQGIELVPLTKRNKIYPTIKILRPSKEKLIKGFVKYMIGLWANNRDIKYDYFLLLRIAIAKRLGIDIFVWGKKNKFICSELVQEYCNLFTDEYNNFDLITPQDFIRYKSDNLIEIN